MEDEKHIGFYEKVVMIRVIIKEDPCGLGMPLKVLTMNEYGRHLLSGPSIMHRFLQARLRTLRESRCHHFQLAGTRENSATSPVFCMSVDPAEQK
ncbi:unnamed protein product [Enterobius vermicularis]|uniref:Uncharacterized protein n=1 Tax=Enterobius vermicularis TaxID=51028 RepID=A0A0N4VRA9_ENTVE|nr:unnamed protein product [Enterobius vermicularis]